MIRFSEAFIQLAIPMCNPMYIRNVPLKDAYMPNRILHSVPIHFNVLIFIDVLLLGSFHVSVLC
jgi:hypothetical protein